MVREGAKNKGSLQGFRLKHLCCLCTCGCATARKTTEGTGLRARRESKVWSFLPLKFEVFCVTASGQGKSGVRSESLNLEVHVRGSCGAHQHNACLLMP